MFFCLFIILVEFKRYFSVATAVVLFHVSIFKKMKVNI